MAYGVYKHRKSGVYQQDTDASYETLTKRIKCSLKTENKRIAEDRARQNYDAAIEELRCRFHGIVPPKPPQQAPKLRSFYEDEYLPWATNEYAHRQRTLRGVKEHMNIVLADDVLSALPLDGIDEDVVDKFKARLIRLKYSGCTVNHALGALRRLLRVANRWSRKKGYKIHLPDFSGLRMRERVHDRVVTVEEEGLYSEKCSRRHLVFLKLLINTGMEPGYAAAARWEDIQFDTDIPYVHDRCQKTNTRERDIPMTDELHSVLLEWWMEQGRPSEGWVFVSPKDAKVHCPLWSFHTTHKRIFGKSLPKNRGKRKHSDKMKHLMKDYGLVHKEGEKKGRPVEYFRLYDLRHRFLTRLGKQGHSATVIASIAGWSSTRMALRYVHHDLEDKARAIATLNQAARS